MIYVVWIYFSFIKVTILSEKWNEIKALFEETPSFCEMKIWYYTQLEGKKNTTFFTFEPKKAMFSSQDKNCFSLESFRSYYIDLKIFTIFVYKIAMKMKEISKNFCWKNQ